MFEANIQGLCPTQRGATAHRLGKRYLISVPQELGELLFWRVRRQNPVLVKRVFLISLKT